MALELSQQAALEQLQAITASTSQAARDRDERILREVGWNVQNAVEHIFSLGPVAEDSPATPFAGRGFAQMDIDDSDVNIGATSARPRATSGSRPKVPPRATGGVGLSLWRTITWPVNLVVSIMLGSWYFIIRTVLPLSLLPYLPRLLLPPSHSTPSSSTRPSVPQDPDSCAQRFIESLDGPTGGEHPDFFRGGYKKCLDLVRTEARVACVVLTCAEHEDDEIFKREVLSDQELIKAFEENNMLVWGGDVRDREAHQVAKTLLITTFPSITFLSLLPPPATPANSSRAPRLTILTTLSGSPASTTSTSQILQTISNSILPRTSTFLSRIKRDRLVVEEGRRLRMEQDQALKMTETRDRDRILQKRLERETAERQEREQSEAADLAKRNKAEEERKEVERREKTLHWRRYARKNLLLAEPPVAEKRLRIGMRLPHSPTRHVRFFSPTASTTTELLYIYAETLLIPDEFESSSDPDQAPNGFDPSTSMSAIRICTSFPRKEISRVGGAESWSLVKEMGGALVVEVVEGRKWGPNDSGGESSGSDSDA